MARPKVKREEVECKICNKLFLRGGRDYRKTYCSTVCYKKRDTTAWNKGLEGFGKWAKTAGIAGKDSPTWKGEDVGYRGLHVWVELVLGKPDTCTYCNKKGTGHNMHWANISKQYKRDKEDWVRLCPKCHKAFDLAGITTSGL